MLLTTYHLKSHFFFTARRHAYANVTTEADYIAHPKKKKKKKSDLFCFAQHIQKPFYLRHHHDGLSAKIERRVCELFHHVQDLGASARFLRQLDLKFWLRHPWVFLNMRARAIEFPGQGTFKHKRRTPNACQSPVRGTFYGKACPVEQRHLVRPDFPISKVARRMIASLSAYISYLVWFDSLDRTMKHWRTFGWLYLIATGQRLRGRAQIVSIQPQNFERTWGILILIFHRFKLIHTNTHKRTHTNTHRWPSTLLEAEV